MNPISHIILVVVYAVIINVLPAYCDADGSLKQSVVTELFK